MDLIKYNFLTALNCFSISALLSSIFTPFLIKIGNKFKLFDYPSSRKRHKIEVVNIGGISLFIGIFPLIISTYILMKLNLMPTFDDLFMLIPLIFFSNLIIFSTGFYDDKFSLSPLVRLIIQFSSASLIWLIGLRIETLNLNFISNNLNVIFLPEIISFLITIIWITAIINAINWLDGIDGLAAGVSLLISLGLMIISFYLQNNLGIIFSSTIVGSCLGFLFYNYSPAKIIMGDSGSNLLGFILAITTIIILRNQSDIGIIPFSFMLFFVPILDMLKVIIIRVNSGKSPFYPDRNHLHFQLLEKNISERKVRLIIYLLVVSSLSLSLMILNFNIALLLFLIAIIGIILIFLRHYFIDNI